MARRSQDRRKQRQRKQRDRWPDPGHGSAPIGADPIEAQEQIAETAADQGGRRRARV
jgi:hypothetical protein